MAGGKLNALKLRTLINPGRYGDGDGLWLQVRDADHRSWLYRFMFAGKPRQMGLGPFPDVSLADGREAARKCRAMVREGQDPIDARKQVKAANRAKAGALTFKQVADRYIAAHEASWSNEKHKYQWRQTLDVAAAGFGYRLVADVATGDVMRVLDKIWQVKPETASRLRGRIESVLDYATARGWRTGDNPARWRGHLAKLLPAPGKVAKVQHQPALPWQDVGTFMAALDKQEGVAALALRFTVLTAARTGEVIGARWTEFDLTTGLWSIPANRMKMKRPHRVPLSPAALVILKAADPDRDGWVFPGGKAKAPMSNMGMLMLLRRMNPHTPEEPARWRDAVSGEPISVHGFRSTFRDWCAESTNYPRELAEKALAHMLPDAIESAYQRSDMLEKRQRLMADWATFCTRLPVTGEVVPIRA